jgi:CO/xanthine dehydrogenase Mo-binding subunit
VLVDGVPVPACDTPVWAAADRPVTTVEALAGHPVDVEFRSGDGNPPLGVGEMAQGPTAAAIGNALCHAIGVRVRTLPLTTENVVAAMPG